MTIAPDSLHGVFDRALAGISQARKAFTPQLGPREVGTIISITTGIAKVSGLPGAGYEELLKFPGDVLGIAFNVDEDEIGVVLLGDYWRLQAGDEVERTGRVMDVVVGEELRWGASSTPWAALSMARGRWLAGRACRSSAPPRRSWTARPSPCRSRPA